MEQIIAFTSILSFLASISATDFGVTAALAAAMGLAATYRPPASTRAIQAR